MSLADLPADLSPLDGFDSIVDARASHVQRVIADERPLELAQRVARHWAARGAPVLRAEEGGWLMVSTLEEDAIVTMQIRAHGDGSEAWISRTRSAAPTGAGAPSTRTAQLAHEVAVARWLPAECTVRRRLAHGRGNEAALTLIATCEMSLNELLAALEARLSGAGFGADALPGPAVARPVGPDRVLARRRGDESLVVTIASHPGRCALVLHWSRR